MSPKIPSDLRLDKAAFFKDLGYEPHPGQLQIHASTAPRRIVACGVRWGKTRSAAMEALAAALQPRERSIGWVVAPTYDLADRVFRELGILVAEHFRHRVIKLREHDKHIVIRNLGGGIRPPRAGNGEVASGEGDQQGEGGEAPGLGQCPRGISAYVGLEAWAGHPWRLRVTGGVHGEASPPGRKGRAPPAGD